MTEQRLLEIEQRIASATAETVVSILVTDLPELLAAIRVYMGLFGEDTNRFLQGGSSAQGFSSADTGGGSRPGDPGADRGDVPARLPDLRDPAAVQVRGPVGASSPRRSRRRTDKDTESARPAGGGVEAGGGAQGPALSIEPRGSGFA